MMLNTYLEFIKENKNNFDFRELFLRLTEYTIPAGEEEILEPILKEYVPNLKRDNIGNYYTIIGNSKTLFTSHLDTYSKKKQKINHVFDGSYIKTDGTTILGGDNKNGVLVLLYMISKGVPGTYFFFLGEESIVNQVGCWGSTNALKNNPEFFKNFDRAIAFDRRGKGSLVRRQVGRWCASEEFSNGLINQFAEQGLEFKIDKAFRTDSAVFMDIIPEITNLSSGGEYEHTFMESTDIEYLERVAVASSRINWDNLPVVRIPEKVKSEKARKEYTEEVSRKSEETFKRVRSIMGAKGYTCLNAGDFQPGTVMVFDKYLEDKIVKLRIIGDSVETIEGHSRLGKFKKGGYSDFERKQRLKIKNLARGIIGIITKKMSPDGEMSYDGLDDILYDYNIERKDFIEYIKSDEDYSKYFEFKEDYFIMDIRAGQILSIKRQEDQQNLVKKL